MTTYRQDRRRQYFYYVCPKKGLEHNYACKNKNHRAEPLERKVMEAVAGLLADPAQLERRIEERIERERKAMRNPERQIGKLTQRLERLVLKRRNYQDQQAAGHMTIEELGERLSMLDKSREALRRELEAARNQHGLIEELEIERRIILGFYSGLALGNLALFPPHERRRLYKTLEPKVVAHAHGSIEVRGNFEVDFFPSGKETHDLVASIAYSPEQQARREAFSAALADDSGDRLRTLISAGTTPTCSAYST